MTVILALDDGIEAKTIARAHRLDENTIRVWRERYEDKGAYGLGDNHYVPRNRLLSDEEEHDLDEFLADKVTADTTTIVAIINERYGVAYTRAGARELMLRLGYSWHEPHPEPNGASADEQRTAAAEIEELRKKVGDNNFYYLDAVHGAYPLDCPLGLRSLS